MATLFRKRLIPSECVNLKDDTIIHIDEDTIITSWKTFRPKAEFSHGVSYYVLKEGYKISSINRMAPWLIYTVIS